VGIKKLNLTETKIEKMLLSGRGKGNGREYQSWLKTGDFLSKGRSSRVKSINVIEYITHFQILKQIFYIHYYGMIQL